MNKSETIKELATSLALAQRGFKPILKTDKVDFSTKDGGRKKYNYAPLSEVIEATRQALADNGLSVTQPTRIEDGHLFVETWLLHNSGEWIQSEMYVCDIHQTPQVEGSALTYRRRYSLSSLLGVASEEDDDGEAGGDAKPGATVTKEQPRVAPSTPAADPNGHWCQKHNVAFKQMAKLDKVWYSHKAADGTWCNEPKEQPKPPSTEPDSLFEDVEGTKGPSNSETGQKTQAEAVKPPATAAGAAGEGNKPRDVAKIGTIEQLAKALKEDFKMTYQQQFDELNIKDWTEFGTLGKTAADAYRKVAAVKAGPPG